MVNRRRTPAPDGTLGSISQRAQTTHISNRTLDLDGTLASISYPGSGMNAPYTRPLPYTSKDVRFGDPDGTLISYSGSVINTPYTSKNMGLERTVTVPQTVEAVEEKQEELQAQLPSLHTKKMARRRRRHTPDPDGTLISHSAYTSRDMNQKHPKEGPFPCARLPTPFQLLARGPNDSISLTLLQAVDTTNAHTLNAGKGYMYCLMPVQKLLWNDTGTGAFDGRFVPFSSSGMAHQLRDRIKIIINHHSQHTDANPTPLQTLATRLSNEIEAHKVNQRRKVRQRIATNRKNKNIDAPVIFKKQNKPGARTVKKVSKKRPTEPIEAPVIFKKQKYAPAVPEAISQAAVEPIEAPVLCKKQKYAPAMSEEISQAAAEPVEAPVICKKQKYAPAVREAISQAAVEPIEAPVICKKQKYAPPVSEAISQAAADTWDGHDADMGALANAAAGKAHRPGESIDAPVIFKKQQYAPTVWKAMSSDEHFSRTRALELQMLARSEEGSRIHYMPNAMDLTAWQREVSKQKPIKTNKVAPVPCMKRMPPLPHRCEHDNTPHTELPQFCKLVNFPTARNDGNCVMCDESEFAIPKQNKGVCNNCDVAIWVVNPSGMNIKWCKGCKNFRKWVDFGVKGHTGKCERCRHQQRNIYANQKHPKEGPLPCARLPTPFRLLARGPNDSISLTLLQAVDTTNAHTLNAGKGYMYCLMPVQKLLWNDTGTGAFDGRFAPFSSNRITCNLGKRIRFIINHHAQHTDANPTPLQTLATRLFDEIKAHKENRRQRVPDGTLIAHSAYTSKDMSVETTAAVPQTVEPEVKPEELQVPLPSLHDTTSLLVSHDYSAGMGALAKGHGWQCRGLGGSGGRGGGGRGRDRTGAGGAVVALAGALDDAGSNRVGGASNSHMANLAERRRTGETVASQAASDDEPRQIDQANAADMRCGRTIYSADVLDGMKSAIIQSTRSAIGALNRNSNCGGGQGQPPQQPHLQQQSLAEEIRDLYQLRSLAQAAGNTASVERYNQTIAGAEDELLACPSYCRRLSDAGAGGNVNDNAGAITDENAPFVYI